MFQNTESLNKVTVVILKNSGKTLTAIKNCNNIFKNENRSKWRECYKISIDFWNAKTFWKCQYTIYCQKCQHDVKISTQWRHHQHNDKNILSKMLLEHRKCRQKVKVSLVGHKNYFLCQNVKYDIKKSKMMLKSQKWRLKVKNDLKTEKTALKCRKQR